MTGLIIFIGVLILGYIIVKKMNTSHVSASNNSEEDIPENDNDDKVQEPEKEKEPEPDYYVRGDNLFEEHKGIIKCSNIKSAQFLAGMLLNIFANKKKR